MEEDLKALRIDRNRRRDGPSRSLWWMALAAFLLGAVLSALLVRNLSRQTPDTAAAEVPADRAVDVPAAGGTDGEPDRDRPLLIASGYIVPRHRIEVSSRIMGKVAWVGVDRKSVV